MAKVLIIGPFHANGMALLEARGDVDFEIVDGRSEAELADKIRDADAATIRTAPLTAAVIDRAERLKVVSRHGVGYDNIDVAALTTRGIPLAIAADANATAVAEHTLFSCWHWPSRRCATTGPCAKAIGRSATASRRST